MECSAAGLHAGRVLRLHDVIARVIGCCVEHEERAHALLEDDLHSGSRLDWRATEEPCDSRERLSVCLNHKPVNARKNR